jgi:hypothetical protein
LASKPCNSSSIFLSYMALSFGEMYGLYMRRSLVYYRK